MRQVAAKSLFQICVKVIYLFYTIDHSPVIVVRLLNNNRFFSLLYNFLLVKKNVCDLENVYLPLFRAVFDITFLR